MKAITVGEAQTRLAELIAEACRGELGVLTNGDKRVALQPGIPLDLEEDSPELESELLKALEGPFAPYSAEVMREIGEGIIREKQQKRSASK